MCFALFSIHVPGLQAMTEELGSWTYRDSQKERLHATFKQMFPTYEEKRADAVKSLTESYHKYKREYVKHLSFSPDNENLSKCILSSQS